MLRNALSAASALRLDSIRAAAEHRAKGLTVDDYAVHGAAELPSTLEAIKRAKVEALIVDNDGFFISRAAEIAAGARMPAVSGSRDFVEAGLLASYGASVLDVVRRSASHIDRILKGARPGDLPVEQPTKFEMIINLKTAKALGLTIPPTILARADELIE